MVSLFVLLGALNHDVIITIAPANCPCRIGGGFFCRFDFLVAGWTREL